MSNTLELTNYLMDESNGFLLNNIHNGKALMLSGEWGTGKTYFWKNGIEKSLSEKLNIKEKACIYVSLYGKNDLNTLKEEVFIKAASEKKIISKEVSAFGFDVLSSIKDSDLVIGKILNATSKINDYRKSKKGITRLEDGGVICFDDFERKSKNIDLNDLFGFISQLTHEFQCKVVIILNSDVFEKEEAKVFKRVKEKTINKFLHFQPTIEELFDLISNDEKYTGIEDHKAKILSVIKETKELNARIYTQVLDNCLEWISEYGDQDIRVLILSTISFIRYHIIFRNEKINEHQNFSLIYRQSNNYPDFVQAVINRFCYQNSEENFLQNAQKNDENDFISSVKKEIVRQIHNGKYLYPENRHDKDTEWVDQNIEELKGFYIYGIKLYIAKEESPLLSDYMYDFVENGILPNFP